MGKIFARLLVLAKDNKDKEFKEFTQIIMNELNTLSDQDFRQLCLDEKEFVIKSFFTEIHEKTDRDHRDDEMKGLLDVLTDFYNG